MSGKVKSSPASVKKLSKKENKKVAKGRVSVAPKPTKTSLLRMKNSPLKLFSSKSKLSSKLNTNSDCPPKGSSKRTTHERLSVLAGVVARRRSSGLFGKRYNTRAKKNLK